MLTKQPAVLQQKIHGNSVDKLYREHVNDLLSYALHLGFDRETSKDAIHDVFYKLCINDIDLELINNARFYLFRALKNRLLDIHKQKRATSELPSNITSDDLPFTINVTIEDSLIHTEEEENLKKRVEQLVEALSDRQREIIYLRYVQEYDYEEISQLMDINVHSCRKLLHKAISKIRSSSVPLSVFILFF